MRKLVPFLLLLTFTSQLWAQVSRTAVGLRSGQSTGIALKHYVESDIALEGILSFRENGMQLSALTNFQNQFFGSYVSHLYYYFGLGGHAGYYSQRYWEEVDPQPQTPEKEYLPLSLGVDAVLGLAYEPPLFPLAFSLDYKPFVDLYRFSSLRHGIADMGFSVRYVF